MENNEIYNLIAEKYRTFSAEEALTALQELTIEIQFLLELIGREL